MLSMHTPIWGYILHIKTIDVVYLMELIPTKRYQSQHQFTKELRVLIHNVQESSPHEKEKQSENIHLRLALSTRSKFNIVVFQFPLYNTLILSTRFQSSSLTINTKFLFFAISCTDIIYSTQNGIPRGQMLPRDSALPGLWLVRQRPHSRLQKSTGIVTS